MKRFRISMIIIMLIGVLLGGVGAGAAFVELSDLEYADEVWIGGEETEVKKFTYKMQDRSVDEICIYTGGTTREQPELVEDAKVKLDEVLIEVTYNPGYCEPMMESYGVYDSGAHQQEDIHVWTRVKSQDSLKLFMDVKDKILKELKEKRISSYQMVSVVEVKVYVNPLNADKLVLTW